MVCYNNAAIAAATKEAESPMFGIKTLCDGTVGWMVGKNNDVVLFPDKGAAAAALRKMKASDA